jgi:predicted nuclease with TOPRIM domain
MAKQKAKTIGTTPGGDSKISENRDKFKPLEEGNITLLERIEKLQAKLANVDNRLNVLERERKKYGIKDSSDEEAEKRLLDLLETFDNEKSL